MYSMAQAGETSSRGATTEGSRYRTRSRLRSAVPSSPMPSTSSSSVGQTVTAQPRRAASTLRPEPYPTVPLRSVSRQAIDRIKTNPSVSNSTAVPFSSNLSQIAFRQGAIRGSKDVCRWWDATHCTYTQDEGGDAASIAQKGGISLDVASGDILIGPNGNMWIAGPEPQSENEPQRDVLKGTRWEPATVGMDHPFLQGLKLNYKDGRISWVRESTLVAAVRGASSRKLSSAERARLGYYV